MKGNILTIWFVFVICPIFGQITLQKTYNYSTGVVKLETHGYKYFLMDVPGSQCRIYNMDHSLFMTINCAVPTENYLADIKYVSENLFNSDSKIELVYTYYQYFQTTNSYYYVYNSAVIDENGSNLMDIDGARFIYVYKTGDTEYKLFAYCYDYSVFPEIIWTNIYSLPGTYIPLENLAVKQPELFLEAYPNPATDIIRLAYELPANTKSAKMNLLDSTGRIVKNFQIDGHSDHIVLNVNDLSAGIYYYNIEYNNLRTTSKKVVVQ
jgi:hypothetical protein